MRLNSTKASLTSMNLPVSLLAGTASTSARPLRPSRIFAITSSQICLSKCFTTAIRPTSGAEPTKKDENSDNVEEGAMSRWLAELAEQAELDNAQASRV